MNYALMAEKRAARKERERLLHQSVSLIDRPSLDDNQPFPTLSRLPVKVSDPTGLGQFDRLSSGNSVRRVGSALHVRFQNIPTWATPSGVFRKRKRIESLGIPDLKGRRFITLTLDRDLFDGCPIAGYLAAKDHLRRFLEAGRVAKLWKRSAWWCWKLEFQKDGWAHWHLILDRTKKFNVRDLKKIRKIWGLGGTDVRRISTSKYGYQFKYAFKGVFQDDADSSGLCLPQWFLDYYCPSVDGEKPVSFARVRFWQTSKGFYTGIKPVPQAKPVKHPFSIRPRTVRELLDDRASSVLVISRDRLGRYVRSVRLRLAVDFAGFSRHHLWDAEHGAAATLSMRSFMCSPETVKNKLIEKTEKWKLQLLQQTNRLTMHLALKFRQQRLTMEFC